MILSGWDDSIIWEQNQNILVNMIQLLFFLRIFWFLIFKYQNIKKNCINRTKLTECPPVILLISYRKEGIIYIYHEYP